MMTTELGLDKRSEMSRDEQDRCTLPAPALVCIVVHGTFAPDAEWTHENAALRRAIAARAGGNVTFEVCKWSGLNTHAGRIKGGREFAKIVAGIRRRPNRSRIVTIAHSHGGNVVAYGSRNVPSEGQTDAVVTLGTPFLALRPRHLERYFRILDVCLHGMVLGALVVPFLVISHFIWQKIPLPPLPEALATRLAAVPVSSALKYLVAAPLYGVVGLAFGWTAASATWLLFVGRPLFEFAVNDLMPKMMARQRDVMARIALPALAASRVLAVSVRFDEAGWLLRSVDAIAQLPFMVLTLIGLPAALAVLVFVVVYGFVDSGVGWYFIWRAPDAFGGFVSRAAPYAFTALLGSTALFLLFQIVVVGLPQVRKIGFFGESVADYALVRIATAIAPPNTGAAWVAKYSRVGAAADMPKQASWLRLRHSAIYNDPDVIADVAEWVVDGAMPSRATSLAHAPDVGTAHAERLQ